MTSYDVVAAGETMAALVGDPPGQLGAGDRLLLDAGGAESNVAICLARAGHRVAWLSRLGADSLGRMVARRIAAAGVDISLTRTDPDAPTGLYLREPGQVWYYRAGSAASRMTPSIWEAEAAALHGARVVYLTGITPALSPSCHDLVTRALRSRPVTGACYAFDVNHRPSLWGDPGGHPPGQALWPPGAAACVLAGLARRADLVFAGRDEAHALWGTASADDVRDLLPEPRVLVVKDAEVGATSFGPHGRVHVPAPQVQVVDPVGAGDAFAAGYLHGLLRGAGEAERLAIGHSFAAAVLCVAGDIADAAFDAAVADAALADEVAADEVAADEVAADAAVADAAAGTIKQKGSRHADI